MKFTPDLIRWALVVVHTSRSEQALCGSLLLSKPNISERVNNMPFFLYTYICRTVFSPPYHQEGEHRSAQMNELDTEYNRIWSDLSVEIE
jgi:hypothetical protein